MLGEGEGKERSNIGLGVRRDMDRGGKALEEEGEIPDSRGSGWRKECPGLLISTALCFSRSVEEKIKKNPSPGAGRSWG